MTSLQRVSSGKYPGDFEVRLRNNSDCSPFPSELRPDIIRKRLEVGNGITIPLLLRLLKRTCLLLRSSENVLQVQAPCVVFGDLHGQLHDFLKMYDSVGVPSATNQYLFLGDYVDRGEFSVELITFLLSLKLSYPDHVHILRGNHECAEITAYYGFEDDCLKRYNKIIYDHFLSIFNAMPVAAVLSTPYGDWFCVHGGLPPTGMEQGIYDLNKLNRFQEPDPSHENVNHICLFDMLWTDPMECCEYGLAEEEGGMTQTQKEMFTSEAMGWLENESRGCSQVYGVQPVTKFLKQNNMRGIIRGHEFQENGIGLHFSNEVLKKLIMPNGDMNSPLPPVTTVFSASNYCGRDGNTGAIIKFGIAKENDVEIIRFDPVEDAIIDNFLKQGELQNEKEQEEMETKNSSANESKSLNRSFSRSKNSSIDSIKMNSFQEASYLIQPFLGVDTRTSLFRSIELYEKYTLKATRSSRKSVHNKQLWKWAKAKLTEKAVGRFKQHHSILNLPLKGLVMKIMKKKKTKGMKNARSSSELKPSFREHLFKTTFHQEDLSILNKNEIKALHLIYDMLDMSSSCELTEDDLTAFYDDLENESGETEEQDGLNEILRYNDMSDVVRIIASDSFHITASDFLKFSTAMKKISMKKISMEDSKGVVATLEVAEEDDEEEDAEEEDAEEEELRTTGVYQGYEVGFSITEGDNGNFYYSKNEISTWNVPVEGVKLSNWEAVLDPVSKTVYYYCLVDGAVTWDVMDVQ